MLKQIFCKIHESWQYLWVGTSYFRALCANFYWERGDYDILSTRVWVPNFVPKIFQDFLKIYGYWHWRVKNLLVCSQQWTIFSLTQCSSQIFFSSHNSVDDVWMVSCSQGGPLRLSLAPSAFSIWFNLKVLYIICKVQLYSGSKLSLYAKRGDGLTTPLDRINFWTKWWLLYCQMLTISLAQWLLTVSLHIWPTAEPWLADRPVLAPSRAWLAKI